MTELIDMLSNLNEEQINKEKLIMIHIKAESKYKTKNCIDKYHTYLFRDIKTLIGYRSRYRKYNVDPDTSFPYGTAILGVCVIMHSYNNPDLARLESELICSHPQSILASEGIITLYQTNSLDETKKVVKKDPILLQVCEEKNTNVNLLFLQHWVVQYFLAAVYGKMNWKFEQKHTQILDLIYHIGRS